MYVYIGNNVYQDSDYLGLWTKEGILAIICCEKYRYVIDNFNARGLTVVSFEKATDIWRYINSGELEYKDLSLNLNGNRSGKIIRLNARLNDEQAAKTLFHEIQHTEPELKSLDYLENEIEVRIRSEQFAIDMGIPATMPKHRKRQGNRVVPNREAIEQYVLGSSYYNPKGKRRIKRTYEGQKNHRNWKCV